MTDRLQKLIVSGTLVSKPAAKQYLVCFPWAGGGAAQFIRWNKMFPDDIEVLAVRLPGRETRLGEEPYQHVQEIAKDAADVIASKYSDKPVSLFGHSFGSRQAFETYQYLKKFHNIEARVVFVSGAFAPGSKIGNQVLQTRIPEQLTDDKLLEYLQRLGGTPQAVLENKEMLKLFLPPLRDDFVALNNYSYDPELPAPLTCPLYVMDGKDDIEHQLQEWQSVTSGTSDIKYFTGGHFFLLAPGVQQSVTDFIIDKLRINYSI